MKDTPAMILTRRLRSLSDDDLCDELRAIVNAARNNPTYDRELARAIGEECRRRGVLRPLAYRQVSERMTKRDNIVEKGVK